MRVKECGHLLYAPNGQRSRCAEPHGAEHAHEHHDGTPLTRAAPALLDALRDTLKVFRNSMDRGSWLEWTGRSPHGPEICHPAIIRAIELVAEMDGPEYRYNMMEGR